MLRVVQPRRRLRLAAEPLQGQAVVRNLAGQDLERHPAAQADLLGLVDDPHPAPADLAEDAVVAQPPLLARGWGRRGLRAVGPGVVVDRQVLLDHHQGRQQLADLIGQLGVAGGQVLDARPLAGPEPRQERLGDDLEGVAIDGGFGQKILRLRVGFQQLFHPEPQRGVAAAGLLQIRGALGPRLLLEPCEEDRFHLRRTGHGTAPLRRVPLFNATNHSRGRNNGGLHATRGDTVGDRQSPPSATWGLSRGLGHRWLKTARSLADINATNARETPHSF